MKKIMVSACLLGKNCKYNGKNNLDKNVEKFLEGRCFIEVCPEEISGLTTPRVPSEIETGFDGEDVLKEKSKVFSKIGTDMTADFLKGARKTLDIALKNKVEIAILKESSPSCGSKMIYDGSFSNKKKVGRGVTSALLEENGIKVISEEDIVRFKKSKW